MAVAVNDSPKDADPPIEQRLERFAEHLRRTGYDVQSNEDAVRWLALAVDNTERGIHTFDMSTGPVVNRSFDTDVGKVALDAAVDGTANGEPRDGMARDHQLVVAQIARERKTVLDRPAASAFDTTDGRAIAELNPWRGLEEWAQRQGNERLVEAVGVDERGVAFGQRLGSALALQHAADGYAEIARYAVPGEFLDPRAPYPDVHASLVSDRRNLEERRANGEFPARLDEATRIHAVRLSVDRDLIRTNGALAEARECDAAAPRKPKWVRRLGRERHLPADRTGRTSEVESRLAESAARWNRHGEWRRAEFARATADLSTRPATTPEQRFADFAAYARGRGCDVWTPHQVVEYLEDGRHWTAHGQRWFDTTAPRGAGGVNRDPVYLSGLVGDRIRDGMARAENGRGNVDTNRAMLKVVKEVVDSGLHLANGVPLYVTDTPDGRAVNRLRLKDPETQQYLSRLARQNSIVGAVLWKMQDSTERFGNRVHDAVAHQFAVDARSNLAAGHAVAVNAPGTTPLDGVVAEDRKGLARLGISRATDSFLGVSSWRQLDELRELDVLRSGQYQGHGVRYHWEGSGGGADHRAHDRSVERVRLARKMDGEAARLGQPRLSPELTQPNRPLDVAQFHELRPPDGPRVSRTRPLSPANRTPGPRTVDPGRRERNPVRSGRIRGGEHDVRVAGHRQGPEPGHPR